MFFSCFKRRSQLLIILVNRPNIHLESKKDFASSSPFFVVETSTSLVCWDKDQKICSSWDEQQPCWIYRNYWPNQTKASQQWPQKPYCLLELHLEQVTVFGYRKLSTFISWGRCDPFHRDKWGIHQHLWNVCGMLSQAISHLILSTTSSKVASRPTYKWGNYGSESWSARDHLVPKE